jgi:hypothetical protein
MLLAHLADPDAHTESGQSLYVHKISDVIDHLVKSVVRDKLAFNRFQIEVYFESLDGWGKSAGVGIDTVGLAEIDTTAVNGNTQFLNIEAADANENGASPANSPFWKTRVKINQTTSQTIYIISGDPGIPAGYGFKIVNGTLYAVWIDDGGTEHTQTLGGITLTNWNTYEIDFTAGSKIDFYINDNLEYSATTNLPVAAVSAFINYNITTNANAIKKMYIQYLIYDEDFFN